MTANEDLRYIATENKIREAFFDLINTVPFEKMNVKMIVDHAEMNRTTFYLHYKDKYDLVDTIELEFFEEIKQRMETRYVVDGKLILSIEVFSLLSGFISENKDIFVKLAGPNGDPWFLDKHFNRVGNAFEKYLFAELDSISSSYIIVGIKGMFTSFLKEWINSGFSETPEEFCEKIKEALNYYHRLVSSIM